ncbi:MAG TPA: Glu/Leu/Phe/Val dehydrogenase dimerization domain-containing protein [Gammaproteobacteria bacterium]|nr:Glu/Leu/Phe/Val dehydrogenase dimerization domain-containing protein [Gammaproteobacteria bacterium]
MNNLQLQTNTLGIKDIRIKNDQESGLFSIIALHKAEQPAIGGCRILSHNNVQAALDDVCLLAHAMFCKASLHCLPYGGGKSIILAPPLDKRKVWLQSFANFVNECDGKYITAIDSGTTPDDMEYIQQFTPYVLSTTNQPHTSLATAQGVFNAIQASLEFVYSQTSKNKDIVIQGLGSVGYQLAQLLINAGANVFGYDTNDFALKKASEIGVVTLTKDNYLSYPCHVFAPCAMGGIINSHNYHIFNTSIICGAANNPLESPTELASKLNNKGILYVPDFLSNAGGLIYVSKLYNKDSEASIHHSIRQIYNKTLDILDHSKSNSQTAFDSSLDHITSIT